MWKFFSALTRKSKGIIEEGKNTFLQATVYISEGKRREEGIRQREGLTEKGDEEVRGRGLMWLQRIRDAVGSSLIRPSADRNITAPSSLTEGLLSADCSLLQGEREKEKKETK